MFNVCPGCGEYTDAKEVINAPVRAVCPNCGHECEFLSLPLYVITGASGSGKTTAALELVAATQDFVILDQDILWNDAFNDPENDYRLFRNTWLRMVKNIHQAVDSVTTVKNAQGQTTKVTDVVHGSVVQTTSYSYYPDGQLSGETIVTSGPNGKGTGTTEISTWTDTKGGTQPAQQHDKIITGGSRGLEDFATKGEGNDFSGKHRDSLKGDSGGVHAIGAASHDDRVHNPEPDHGSGVKIDDDIPLEETPSASKVTNEPELELKTGGGTSAPISSPVFNPANLGKITPLLNANGGTLVTGKLTGVSRNTQERINSGPVTPSHTVHSVEGATKSTITPSLMPSLPANNLR